MSSSPPPSKRRKNSTATTNIEENDNIKSLLSTLFDPHGTKQKSKKRKVDATKTIMTVHTPSTIPSTVETAQLKPTTTDEKRGSRQYMKWEDRFNQAKQYYSPNGELISGMSCFYVCVLSFLIAFANRIYTNISYYYLFSHIFINHANAHLP